jgi:hypothetical protein
LLNAIVPIAGVLLSRVINEAGCAKPAVVVWSLKVRSVTESRGECRHIDSGGRGRRVDLIADLLKLRRDQTGCEDASDHDFLRTV